MDGFGEKPSDWPVVLTIHGIRTTGDWQRELTDVLTRNGFRHVPLGFGFFRAISLLMPWSRARKVEWFRKVYSDQFSSAERLPSVIAHSFGSYIVTKAMLKYDDIRFDKVILCGSIVSRGYPWAKVLLRRRQANRVLNEAGGRDFWARLVEWVVSDAGSSGLTGFKDLADGQVLQLIHERHEHSDYFYRQNYEQRWLPFLQGRPVHAVLPVGGSEVNRKFLFTACTLLFTIAVVAWLVLGGDGLGRIVGLAGAWGSGKPVRQTPSDEAGIAGSAGTSEASIAPHATSNANPSAAEVLEIAKNPHIDAWFEHLRGEWAYLGDLPQREEHGEVFRCIIGRNVLTMLRFESLDAAAGTVSATWRQDGMATHRLVSLQTGPQPFDAAMRERRACLGGQRVNPAKRLLEEAGRFSVDVTGPRDQPAEVALTIEHCTLGGEDCLPVMFGRRSMPRLEAIGHDRLRMGELMFIRQNEVP